jgi:hypothetical protein
MLRNLLKWCVMLPLAVIWISSPIWLARGQAAERHEMRKIYRQAQLEKKVEGTLTFLVDNEGRMQTVRCLLTDGTVVQMGELDQEIGEEGFEPGSLWTIMVAYPTMQEGVPLILEMRRERGKLPE